LNGVLFPAGAQVALQIALRTGVIYLVVLIGVRLSGKPEVGQMTPFDLTLLLLLSNSVQNAMTAPDTSLIGGVIAASTLLLLNYAIGTLSGTSRGFRRVVPGEPSLLIHDGKAIEWPGSTSAWTNSIAYCASTALRTSVTWHWQCWKWMDPSVV
jgi:hypothetical protein